MSLELENEIKKLIISINDLNITLKSNKKSNGSIDCKYVSVAEFCKIRGISRGLFYKNINLFKINKIGRRTFVELTK